MGYTSLRNNVYKYNIHLRAGLRSTFKHNHDKNKTKGFKTIGLQQNKIIVLHVTM